MLNKLNKWILYLMIVVFTIVLSANALAVCCNDVCYTEGICGSDGEWYKGCLEGNGQVYPPDGVLDSSYPFYDGCLTCWCDPANHDDCGWRARNDACLWDDQVCVCDDGVGIDFCVKDTSLTGGGLITGASTVGLAGPPIDSFCLDRDYFSELCTWDDCNLGGSTNPGVWETDPTPSCCSGDDDPELCGSSTCVNRNYLPPNQNPKCLITVSGELWGDDGHPIGEDAIIRLEGETNQPPSGGGTEPLQVSFETHVKAGDVDIIFTGVYGDATYELIAEAEWYGTEVVTPIIVGFNDYALADVILGNEGLCRPDCTLKGTTHCDLQCIGQPGCEYFNQYVADTVCHERMPRMYVKFDPQNPWDRHADWENGKEYVVECCEGEDGPIEKGDIEILSIGVGDRDVVRTERFMLYRGRTVKMMVDAFG